MTDDNPRSVTIDNISELADITHKCTSTELLTQIQVSIARSEGSMVSMASAVQELSARFEEQSREFRQYMQTGHICKHTDQINRNTAAIEFLKAEQQKKQGSDYWVEKFVESVKYLLLFVMGLFVAFILKGGTIQ